MEKPRKQQLNMSCIAIMIDKRAGRSSTAQLWTSAAPCYWPNAHMRVNFTKTAHATGVKILTKLKPSHATEATGPAAIPQVRYLSIS